jgi:hypothetical protein
MMRLTFGGDQVMARISLLALAFLFLFASSAWAADEASLSPGWIGHEKLLIPSESEQADREVIAAAEGTVKADAPEPGQDEMDLGELSKQTSNPVGSLWQLVMQNDYTLFDGDITDDERQINVFKFQPIMPFRLTDEWKLITRPVIPVVSSEILKNPATGDWDRENGLGDVVLLAAFSNTPPTSPNVWGIGPTFIFPTASDDDLGTEKWSVGPVATWFHLGEKWIYGGIVQHWWSFAGDDDRDHVNLTNIQYVLKYRPTPAMSIGFSPNIEANWKNDSDDVWSVPIGLGADRMFRLGKLPVKIGFEAQYYVEQPDSFGAEWNFRFFVTPVIPAPKFASKPLF